jgi:hypothetical protein
MSRESPFGHVATRLCCIRREAGEADLEIPLDQDGFLDASVGLSESARELTPGALVDPRLVLDSGVLVLLGEPGVGKSTTFRALVGPDDSNVVWVDGAELTLSTFHERVGKHLEALPEGGSEPTTLGRFVVVIDQLDESPDVRSIAGPLRRALAGRDVSCLRMLIACRTADFPAPIAEALSSTSLDVHLADLAPLTREQAEYLAGGMPDIDGAELVEAAVEAGAGVLASVPLTLAMLVRTYARHGELESDPTRLFADGIRQLADEPSDRRRANFESTSEQRVAVAARVAARLLLTSRRTLWRGAALQAGSSDLGVESLVGGEELMPNGSTLDVTNSALGEALGTALFTGRGHNRLAFRHSSIAAYLAASHLLQRDVPRRQLESLFLVAGVEGSRTIPTLLRETAAWLVTLDPDNAEWLVAADPESLSAHSRIVDSGHTRALIVESLLERAGEVELSDVRWARSPRRLAHEGLSEQLRAVFQVAGDEEPSDWSENARVRLAVRLARETLTAGLADELLDIAENDAWNPYVRQLAALTAFETQEAASVERLRGVLDRLSDTAYAANADPDDELRGALLSMLWPEHLPTEALIRWLRPRRNSNLIGTYWRFERSFPAQLEEDDVAFVLRWAREVSAGSDRGAIDTSSDTQHGQQSQRTRRSRLLDEGILEALVERALSGPTASELLPDLAALLLPMLRDYETVPYPRPIDLMDESGLEPDSSRSLRRSLTLELFKLAASDNARSRADAWTIINGWTQGANTWRTETSSDGRAGRSRLLSSEDFAWVYREAGSAEARGDHELSKMLSELASILFDVNDSSILDLTYRDRSHPVWEQLKHWFQAIELSSEQAERLRGLHRHTEHDVEPHPEAGEFADSQRLRLSKAGEGDTSAFWQLLWNLQFPPDTLRGHVRLDDDVLSFPGMAVFADNNQTVDYLKEIALTFVHGEDDHRDEWLGTNRYDKRAWAGFLALALLARQGELGEVQDGAWANWVGAIVWFSAVPVNAGDEEMKRVLLRKAASQAPADLGQAVARYLRGELSRGHLASEVRLIDPSWANSLADTWHQLLSEIRDALTTEVAAPETTDDDPVPDSVQVPQTDEAHSHALSIWEDMLEALLRTDTDASDIAVEQLANLGLSERHLALAVRSALVLLRVDAHRWWSGVHETARDHPEFGRNLALATAGSYRYEPLDFDDQQLGEVYRWLSELFPPAGDPDRVAQGAHFVSSEESARDWRDAVLRQLSERAGESELAVSELARLEREFPDRLMIKSNLIRAQVLAGESAWHPPEPNQLAKLLESGRRRLVRSNAELADVVLETLDEIEDSIPSHGDLLWDRVPGRLLPEDEAIWLPKPEAAVSAYLTNELRHRLSNLEVVVNREVLVRQTNEYGAGDRTDILIEATAGTSSRQTTGYDRSASVIEVKGSWNRGVGNSQRDQLAARYLPEADTDQGIYLVAWFPPELWTDVGDDRRQAVATVDPRELRQRLSEQSEDIWNDLHVVTRPLVISIPRARPTS